MNHVTSRVVCTGENCPVAAQCIRHTKYLTEKESEPVLHLLNMNTTTITSDGCEHVHIAKTVVMARGFKAIHDTVPYSAVQMMWRTFPGCTSRRDFYRLLSGEKPMEPELQSEALRYLEALGANTSLGFDSYEEVTI